jgi:hypothetical protein
VERLDGQWLADLADVDARGVAGADQGVQVAAEAEPVLVEAARRLDPPRLRRVVQAGQRGALAVREGGCGFPGCARPLAWWAAHHLRHWLHGSPTDLANRVLVCRAQHRAVHEGGWRLARQADGPA